MTTATLPVTRVVFMEDRAQVERQGELKVTSNNQCFEIPGVSLLAVDRSLKVELSGASLVDARFNRTCREKPRGGLPADASELRRRERSLREELTVRADHVARLQTKRDLLAQTRADLLRAVAEAAGAGIDDAQRWKRELEELSAMQAAQAEALRVAERALALAHEAKADADRALMVTEQPEQNLECTLVLTISGTGAAKLKVSYLVPCALWRPAYRASLLGDKVLVESEAVVWQRTGEDWKDVELKFSTARPTLGTTPPRLVEDVLETRPKTTMEKQTVGVSIREEAIPSAGEISRVEAEMPGLDDGGETCLLSAPGKCAVPSDGQGHRVPLCRFETKAELSRVCAPELTPLVSLVARFPNDSGQVLLAGPVDLVRAGGFVGRSSLSFAAPGETVKLSFGSEDNLRIVRHAEEKSQEGWLTSRRTTRHTIAHFVSNTSSEEATVVIEERIPVSEVTEVEVQVLTNDCSPAPSSVSKDGLVRIELQLAPHGTRKSVFAWQLSAAAKVAGV